MRRRDLFPALAGTCLAAGAQQNAQLPLPSYQPKSMLSVPETRIQKPRFPLIDIHTHISFSRGEKMQFLATPEELLPVMDRCNIRMMVNLTGGRGAGLREAVAGYDKKHPKRFLTFTEPWWSKVNDPGYAKFQGEEIAKAKADGAHGLKILKMLGLTVRDKDSHLVKVDDPRFDPMWAACGDLKMPVTIHVSDPLAFFEPIDRFNERIEELGNHPDWSFRGKDFPSNAELLDARDRVIARHPKTQFIVLHVGNFAENLAHVSARLDKYPNMFVDIGARIGELGRQPRTARKFFDRYQDRILFGTDATPKGKDFPQQYFCEELYQIYARFLETEDEYFDYAPAPVPPQGRWRIYGIGLPEPVLRKVYYGNAERLLGLRS